MPWNPNDYPPDWKAIRARILSRDGNCCRFCGVANHSYRANKPNKHGALTHTKIVLTIAHLDHDKENWKVADDRLAALCQACHLNYDLPRHINNRRYGRNHRKNQQRLFI